MVVSIFLFLDDDMDHGGKITSGASHVFIGNGGNPVYFGDNGNIHIGGNGNPVFIGGAALTVSVAEGAEVGAGLGVEGGPAGMMIGALVGAIIVFYVMPPKDGLKAFPDAKPRGKKNGRERWTDSKGRIHEWDSQHGKVELYDKTGKKHLGEFDPDTGEQTKPADKSRKTEK